MRSYSRASRSNAARSRFLFLCPRYSTTACTLDIVLSSTDQYCRVDPVVAEFSRGAPGRLSIFESQVFYLTHRTAPTQPSRPPSQVSSHFPRTPSVLSRTKRGQEVCHAAASAASQPKRETRGKKTKMQIVTADSQVIPQPSTNLA